MRLHPQVRCLLWNFVPEDIGAAEPKLQMLDSGRLHASGPGLRGRSRATRILAAWAEPCGRCCWAWSCGVGRQRHLVCALGGICGPGACATRQKVACCCSELSCLSGLAGAPFPKLRAWEPSWSDLKRDPQAREARREALKEHLPPVEERRSVLGRVFMGLLAIPLAIGCIPAFAMAFGWGFH